MKLPHALQICSIVFVKMSMRLFFQGSAATNYGQSETLNYAFVGRLFLSATVKKLLKSDSILRKLCSNENGPVFLTHSVV